MKMNLSEIMERLPHRYPFLLVDRVLECDADTYIIVQKNVSYNEPYFQGHFPNYAVFPGVLVIEAMAQSTGLLACEIIGGAPNPSDVFMLVGVDNAKFRKQVIPGDVIIIRAEKIRRSRNMMKFEVTSRVNDELVCSANIMGAFATPK